MIKIITKSVVIENEVGNLMSIQPTANGCYFKFADGTEVTVPINLTQAHQNMMNVVATSKAEYIELDFTNMNQPLKMGPKPTE